MAIIRAVALLRHVSGLARDHASNTFHFEGEATVAKASLIADQVSNFYTGVATMGLPVAAYLSGQLTTVDVNVYVVPGTLTGDRETPVGPPIFTKLGAAGMLTGIAKQSNVNTPQEVAVAVSYQGTPGAGVVQRRRRGRVYIGPLNNGAIVATANVAPRPIASFRTCLEQRLVALATGVDGTAEWVVYSRPYPGRAAVPRVDRPDLPAIPARPGTTVNIDEVWVDDEFDTQRRRGLRRTGRTLVPTGEV